LAILIKTSWKETLFTKQIWSWGNKCKYPDNADYGSN